LCRPHFEAYEQQLLLLGLELPPLLAHIFSSSSGSGATPSTAPHASMHSSAAGASVTDKRSFDLDMQAAAAAAAAATPGHARTGQQVPGVMSLGGVAAASEAVQASREGSNSSVAGSSCPQDFSEIGGMSVCASQHAGEIEVVTWSDTQQSLQQQAAAAEGVEKDKHRSNKQKQGLVRWLRKRFKTLLQRSNDTSSETTTCMGQQQQQPSISAAAAAAQAVLAQQQQQQQQQQEEQQPCEHYVGELPTLSELRLLPSLRHTLSTVLSSNLSTVMSSLGSNSAAMQAVYESSSTGSGHTSGQPSNMPLGASGTAVHKAADVADVAAAAGPLAGNSSGSGSGSNSAGGSNGDPNGSSSSSSIQQGSTGWSLMLQAAGLNTGGSSSSSSDAPIAHTAVHSSSALAATDAETHTAAAPYPAPQQQQQQLAAHELQHMHMLAERYAAQHQLHAEPSGLSTITERSETRTTPRGLSFTSNFTHEFTVLSGRPSYELHWELGRPDSYSSQTTSVCPFAGYTYVPQQQQHIHQQGDVSVAAAAAAMQHPLNATVTAGQSQSQETGLHSQISLTNHGELLQMLSSSTADQHDLQDTSSVQPLVVLAAVPTQTAAQPDAQPVAAVVAHASQVVATVTAAGAEAYSAGPAATATSSMEGTSSFNPAATDQPAAAAAAAMPVVAPTTAAGAATEPDAEGDAMLQQGLQQEQDSMQAALQRLRVQLSTSDVLAAVPSSWGSCEDISDSEGFAIQGDRA
jgi:hypothetical protein